MYSIEKFSVGSVFPRLSNIYKIRRNKFDEIETIYH